MKTISKVIIIFSMSFIQMKCKKDDEFPFLIKNNASSDIYYVSSYSYPNTSLISSNGFNKNNYIPINETKVYQPGTSVFDFNSVFLIYFISADSIEQKGWEYVRTNDVYLSMKEFEKHELEQLDYIIAYP